MTFIFDIFNALPHTKPLKPLENQSKLLCLVMKIRFVSLQFWVYSFFLSFSAHGSLKSQRQLMNRIQEENLLYHVLPSKPLKALMGDVGHVVPGSARLACAVWLTMPRHLGPFSHITS